MYARVVQPTIGSNKNFYSNFYRTNEPNASVITSRSIVGHDIFLRFYAHVFISTSK